MSAGPREPTTSVGNPVYRETLSIATAFSRGMCLGLGGMHSHSTVSCLVSYLLLVVLSCDLFGEPWLVIGTKVMKYSVWECIAKPQR